MQTVDQLDQAYCDLLLEVKKNEHDKEMVKGEKLRIEKEILALKTKMKDLDIALNKAISNLHQKQLEAEVAKHRFWQAKTGG